MSGVGLGDVVTVGAGAASGFMMGGPAGAAVGAGMGVASVIAQREANAANQAAAQKQMDFQERMSGTSHQRQVKDLIKAGLNPTLSANSGASTPTGAISVSEPVDGNLDKAMTSAKDMTSLKQQKEQNTMANFIAAQQLTNQSAQTQSQMELNKALATKAKVEATVQSKEIPKADLMNRVYNLFGKPTISKVEQATQTVAPRMQRRNELNVKQADMYKNMWRTPTKRSP